MKIKGMRSLHDQRFRFAIIINDFLFCASKFCKPYTNKVCNGVPCKVLLYKENSFVKKTSCMSRMMKK